MRSLYVAALVVVVCVAVFVGDATAHKKKPAKPKKRRVGDIVKDLEANVSALWHEVDMLQQPVHVHIHGHDGDLEHVHHHDDHMDHYYDPDPKAADAEADAEADDDDDDDDVETPGEVPMGDAPDNKKKSKKMKTMKMKKPMKKGMKNDSDDEMGHGGHDDHHHHHHHHDHDHDHDHGHHWGHHHDHHMGHHHDHHMGHHHDHHMGHHHDHHDHHDHDHMGHGMHDMHHGGHGAHVHIHLHTHDDHEHPEDAFCTDHPPEEYLHARCDVVPSLALEKSQQHKDLKGSIYFRQKPRQPLQVAIDLSGFRLDHSDVKPGETHQHLHGMHGHTFGDVSDDCKNQGGHFNPHGADHGGPAHSHRHPGDFGNLVVMENGTSSMIFNDTMASLFGPHSLLGRGIVIHQGKDDLGMEDTPASKNSGDAGPRIACCAILATSPHEGVWPVDE